MSFSDNSDQNEGILILVVGIVAGAALMACVWVGWAWTTPDDPGPPQPGVATATKTTTDPDDAPAAASDAEDATTMSADATRLERCREVYDAQTGPVEAASRSLDQWEVHIGAMNQLVTGAITLRQANQFWNQTRVGATARLKSFDAAERAFAQRTARCPASAAQPGTSPDLQDCLQAVAARKRTLHLSSVALATWRMHVHHMEMLRDGTMSADEATRLWLQSWRQGDRQVKAYRAAARATAGKTC
jgi:hypothetical protein